MENGGLVRDPEVVPLAEVDWLMVDIRLWLFFFWIMSKTEVVALPSVGLGFDPIAVDVDALEY